jgi:hypothetical protein
MRICAVLKGSFRTDFHDSKEIILFQRRIRIAPLLRQAMGMAFRLEQGVDHIMFHDAGDVGTQRRLPGELFRLFQYRKQGISRHVVGQRFIAQLQDGKAQ